MALSVSLTQAGIAPAFALSCLACLATQALSRRYLARPAPVTAARAGTR